MAKDILNQRGISAGINISGETNIRTGFICQKGKQDRGQKGLNTGNAQWINAFVMRADIREKRFQMRGIVQDKYRFGVQEKL